MTSEQLLATRAALWRQKGEPILTLDDAQAWLGQTGLCLFLPRKAQILAPAPSFVEGCMGETNPTPPRATIETAKEMLARLIEADAALPLNLLGTPADHPDFLVSKEALPFVYALRGDRDWKSTPGSKGTARTSPLVVEVWKLLERRGVLTSAEIQNDLGRELTEAAVLRALHELWTWLRVVPLYQSAGEETLWEPLQSRHQKAIQTGSSMSQVTALSVLVSVYLQSVLAASSEDAEAFLSPLASRSKVREVIRGLTATRQLAMTSMETRTLLYVEGSLPEFPEEPAVVAHARIPRLPPAASASFERKPFVSRAKTTGPGDRPAWKRSDRPAAGTVDRRNPRRPPRPFDSQSGFRSGTGVRPGAAGRPSEHKPGGGRFSKSPATRSGPSQPGTGLRADGTPKKARWRDMPGGRPDQKGKPARFGPRQAETGSETERRSSATRPQSGGGRPPRRREGGSFPPAGGAKPWVRRESSEAPERPSRHPETGRVSSRPAGSGFRPADPGRPSGPNKPFRPDRGPAESRVRSNRPGSDRPRPSFDRPQSGRRTGSFGGRQQGNRSFNRARPSGPGEDRPADERPRRSGGPGGASGQRRTFTSRPSSGSASGKGYSKPESRQQSPAGRKPFAGPGFNKKSGSGVGFKKRPGQGPKSVPRTGGRAGIKPPAKFRKRPE